MGSNHRYPNTHHSIRHLWNPSCISRYYEHFKYHGVYRGPQDYTIIQTNKHHRIELFCFACFTPKLSNLRFVCSFQISTFLAGPKRPNQQYRFEDTTQWILNKNSRKLQDIITAARNESLPDILEDIIKDQTDEENSCIRLLVCKITPYVTKMQKAVFGKEKLEEPTTRGADSMYRHLPATSEVDDRSAICERKYRECDLNEWFVLNIHWVF